MLTGIGRNSMNGAISDACINLSNLLAHTVTMATTVNNLHAQLAHGSSGIMCINHISAKEILYLVKKISKTNHN